MIVELDRYGREYLKWPLIDGPLDGDYEVTFDNGSTWHAAEVDDGHVRILVAGPNATGSGAVVLPVGFYAPEVRLTDTPETPVRSGGNLQVK